ncbi:UNVERIFIED_CONTAM: hypothetical protein PYX00_010329 [Menopon gallinae]|uniref:Contactin n=1 Tax=Menopon gallinae TaxID=328185 RepID=A0AAW2HFA1_9NEOP
MNKIIVAVYAIIPTVFGQFNTNPFGHFQYPGGDPFNGGNSITNDPFNQQQFGNQQFGYNNPVGYDNRFSNVYNNPYSNVYRPGGYENVLRCPQYWVQFQQSCYRFIKSPIRAKNDARRNCQAYESDLVSINNVDEHGFIIYQLLWRDPQRRKWYTGIIQQGPNYWINEADGSPLANMENAFLPSNDNSYGRDAVVYSYSYKLERWGLEAVRGDEQLLYICEVPLDRVHYLPVDDRTHQYGIEVDDPEKIPRGPYFIKQPQDVVFDLSNLKTVNDATLSCFAGGYPTPTYEWFKEEYENDLSTARRIDPLTDPRYSLSGGNLIIHRPDQISDRGSYHCKATNKFGSIVSESVSLSFGFIDEFNLQRSSETGKKNWGHTMFCDPPNHYPEVTYKWTRDYFPNFVDEDRRVFVSKDGALYFSALQDIDKGNYSCTAQSKVSTAGRTGPFFGLDVIPNPNYQQLTFPLNFPKVFPEAPIAGKDIHLECVAFGYPVPSYTWSRKGAPLPKGAVTTNYNRVLILPQVSVEDQGEYVCRAFNDRAALENSVMVSIQAEPNFTIPLTDKHMDYQGELTWTCEAFGIPDVNYTWFKNGEILRPETLSPSERARYRIQDNVLTIKDLDSERDAAMYQCRASNQLRTKYSSAQLRVLFFKPSFKKRPLEPVTYAGEGGNVTIMCNPEAAPKPKFVWKKDNNVIGSGGRRRILENGNLIINRVSRDDEGLYTCTASNRYGVDESYGNLVVLRGPRLTEGLPPRIVTAVNENFTLHCEAVTDELLDTAFIWTHNGIRLHDKDRHQMRVVPDGNTLYIYNATFAEAGEYECIVKGAIGRISSRTTVVIQGPPGPPGGVEVAKISMQSATIQWTDGASNGRPISFYKISARTNWNSTWDNITGIIEARVIDRYTGRKEAVVEGVLSPWSIYEFRVAALNGLGLGPFSAPSPQYSTQTSSPHKAPANVGGGGGKIGDLTISWTPLPPQDQNAPGIYYKIFWRRQGTHREYEFQELKEYGNVGYAVVRIPKEYYYTKYEVKVQAINDIGRGPESPVTVIYSAEDMPQVAPQFVASVSYNSTALNVSWSPISEERELVRGKLIGYRLKYWKKDEIEERSVYYLNRDTRPWSLIVGLQPDTYYYVRVMAYNNAGEGPESIRYLERTYRKAPQKPPSSVHVTGINPSTIRVVWRYVAPSSDEEPLSGYKVRVWEVDQDMATANDTIVPIGSKLEAYIDNLAPGKQYHLRVLAFSLGGDGRMSSPAHTFQMGPTLSDRNGESALSPGATLLATVFAFSLISWL